MATNSVPELLLAKTLAAPFTPLLPDRRSQGNPMACRRRPEGGMVVIAADGRKLWFTAEEVEQALATLKEEARPGKKTVAAGSKKELGQRQLPQEHDRIAGRKRKNS